MKQVLVPPTPLLFSSRTFNTGSCFTFLEATAHEPSVLFSFGDYHFLNGLVSKEPVMVRRWSVETNGWFIN